MATTRKQKGQAAATVYDRFRTSAQAFPAELAYTNGPVAVTYAELAEQAEAVRVRILSLGPAQAGFVAILTADRVNALAAILGAAGSGHAYVLLDADDPDKRLAHILGDVAPFAILADSALLARAGGLGSKGYRTIDLDTLDVPGGGQASHGPPVSPDSLLYVSFTSGSTGTPKGVCQTHRNLAFYVDAYIAAMEIGAGDPISWLFAHGASASNMDIYGALFTGARLCAFELRNESFAAMARWIDDQGIKLLHTVPTVARELAGAVAKDKVFESVRTVDLAGEMLFAGDVARIRPHFPAGCRIFNRLAATEASFISSLRVTEAHEKLEGALPVGMPPPGVEVGIVRDDGSPAAIGETGAIAIASPYIATGYLNRPDLDAEAFSEVKGRPGWRRYTSADLGFIDASGALNFIGRSGSRIKLRGQAVDLAEVEAALLDCPGVTGAVVLPHETDGAEAREILAYLTMAPDTSQEAGAIRKALAQSLPAYMLPSGYVFLDRFPQTATSKVDRKALAAIDLATARFRPGYVPPENEVEELVAATFAEVLDIAPVGRFDDFFLLGGDSLSLVNLQILAAERFGRQFPDLHEDATVQGVAQRLRELEDGGEELFPTVLPLRTEGTAPPLFIVHGRRGQALVSPRFLEVLGEDQPVYAFQARGLDGRSEPHRTVEAMAAEYLAAMKAVQPEGPYFLGGFCAGCYVALEMVRMLDRRGEKIFTPLLIDPPPPTFKRRRQEIPDEFALAEIERRVILGEWRVDLHDSSALQAALKVAKAFEAALVAYEPKMILARSVVIAMAGRWKGEHNVKRAFGEQVSVFLVDGGHAEMLSPDNQHFATAVRSAVMLVAQRAKLYRERLASRPASPSRPSQPRVERGAV